MNIIVLGPQASGKGTQARLLAKKLSLQHLELGSLLRKKAREKSALGREIYQILNQKGTLVSDQIIKQIVDGWLDKQGIKKGIVFDGPPRNRRQYHDIDEMLARRRAKIDKVIFLKVSRETSIRRIVSRRVCPECSNEYNLVTKPPKRDELCDQCQKRLVQRQDDMPKVVERRLATYYRLTKPLIDYIRKQGNLEEVDGERSIEVIHQDIMSRIRTHQAGKK